MPDRRTVLTCPAHKHCQVAIITTPEAELGERKPMTLPMQYTPWLVAHDGVVVEVEHNPESENPDVELNTFSGIVPALRLADLKAEHDARLSQLEGFVKSKRRWKKRYGKAV